MSTIEAATPTVPPKTTLDPNKDLLRTNRTSENATTQSTVTDQNLDMVRNILFGEQVRENEKRQAALERFVRVSVNAWTEDTQRRFDTLQREIQVLKDLLQDETNARREDTQMTKNRLDEVGRHLVDLDKKHRVNYDESQGLLEKEVLRMEQVLNETREELQSQLQQAIQQLRQDKPDRKALAMMLQGVAKQLYDGVKE